MGDLGRSLAHYIEVKELLSCPHMDKQNKR